MPYIDKVIRASLEDGRVPKKPGELNYMMSQLIKGFLAMTGKSYTSYNAAIGVLECLKLELYRRQVAMYEDKKMCENGDVF